MTRYVVLELDHDRWAWSAVIEANSAESAIRRCGTPGVYVAVPQRSWQPLEVKTQVLTRTTVEKTHTAGVA